jgi:hypothetical protein
LFGTLIPVYHVNAQTRVTVYFFANPNLPAIITRSRGLSVKLKFYDQMAPYPIMLEDQLDEAVYMYQFLPTNIYRYHPASGVATYGSHSLKRAGNE